MIDRMSYTTFILIYSPSHSNSLLIICQHLRLYTVGGGPAGQLCPQVSACGSGAAGSLYCAAQFARLVTRQTGPPIRAGGPEQDGLLLHHSTCTTGTATQTKLNLYYTMFFFYTTLHHHPLVLLC